MTLGERAVVLRDGLVQQIDTPERLYHHPANTFVAGFIGSPAMNFLEGRLQQGTLELGPLRLELSDRTKRHLTRANGEVIVGVRPEDLPITTNHAAAAFPAEVQITEQLGPETLAHLRAPSLRIAYLGARSAEDEDEQTSDLGDTLVARFDSNTEISAGRHLQLTINLERVQLFDPTSGDSLLADAHRGTDDDGRGGAV